MRLLALILFSFIIFPAPNAQSQERLPDVPEALQALIDKGAQMRYLGKKHGLEGWISIYQGQEQYYYVTPDGTGFVMGLLFDKEGGMTTLTQVRDLQAQGDGVLDFLAEDKPADNMSQLRTETNEAFTYKSPAERMFSEVENSNFVSFGDPGAPVIYSFMDPQCPHCHDFMEDLREGYLDNGLVQLRMIPVGLREETMAQAAFLLASPDPQERWYNHLDGDGGALPAKSSTNTRGVERNMLLMDSWNFNVTPMTVYKDKNGKIKIVRGRAGSMADILADLPS
ncbi:MAG: thioredoxin fold domain-containing protein [Pseudomonadota bacterium]